MEKKQSKKGMIIELIIYLSLMLICIFVIPRYVIQRTVVDGESMEDTLHSGESLLVQKITKHFSDPDRFDIIILDPEKEYETADYVKRVIGLPGETIQIVGSDILINGKKLEEHYGKDPIENAGIAATPIKLADDEFFVLGDNRSVSCDSRDGSLGPIKRRQIVGKPVLRIWPFNKFGTVK